MKFLYLEVWNVSFGNSFQMICSKFMNKGNFYPTIFWQKKTVLSLHWIWMVTLWHDFHSNHLHVACFLKFFSRMFGMSNRQETTLVAEHQLMFKYFLTDLTKTSHTAAKWPVFQMNSYGWWPLHFVQKLANQFYKCTEQQCSFC